AIIFLLFFISNRRRHTSSKRDWSSDVCSSDLDYELGTVLNRSGRQTIDGETALDYVRARNVSTEFNGDYGRIKRQQLFLASLLRSEERRVGNECDGRMRSMRA